MHDTRYLPHFHTIHAHQVEDAFTTIEKTWLSAGDEVGKDTPSFITARKTPTIADFLCYCEVKQIKDWIALPFFDKLPRLERWLHLMSELEGCKEAHNSYEIALEEWRLNRPANLKEKIAKL